MGFSMYSVLHLYVYTLVYIYMYCYSLLVINYIYLYVHCFNLVDRDECNSVLPLGGIYLNSFETLFIFLIGCDDS